jgi:hypothetical protein
MLLLPVFLVAVVALILGATAPESWAKPLADTAIYIEINDTDEDAGIQIFLDGEGWDSMQVFDPDGNRILKVRGQGSVGIQGITELFLESAEPSFDEQPLNELLELFPEGLYRFEGTTTEGAPLKGKARLTHNLPEAVEITSPEEDDEVPADEDLIVEWGTVSDPNPPSSVIEAYEIVVEKDESNERLRVYSVDMTSADTSVTVPAEFLEPGKDYKVEILAIETSGNKTITEVPFATE